ncbi:hypothetical protein LINPERHAP1_LOCUS16953 [Linum perenne]
MHICVAFHCSSCVLDDLRVILTIGTCRFDRIVSLRPDHGVEITQGSVESSSLIN